MLLVIKYAYCSFVSTHNVRLLVRIQSVCETLYGFTIHGYTPCYAMLCCTVCIMLCYAVCTVLYALCYAVLCCTVRAMLYVLCCGDLLYAIFHCTICTACTVLCYAVLYYTIVRLLRVMKPIVEFN